MTKSGDVIAEIAKSLRGKTGSGTHYVCIAQPKSGSTFMCNVLGSISGYNIIQYSNIMEGKRQFSFIQTNKVIDQNGVVHLHSLYVPLLMAFLLEKTDGVVLMRRNFIEFCYSQRAHIMRRPETDLKRYMMDLDDYSQIEFIALAEFGWCQQFYTGWEAIEKGIINKNTGKSFVKWVVCSDFFKNKNEVIESVCEHINLDFAPGQIEECIKKVASSPKASNNYNTQIPMEEAQEFPFFIRMRELQPNMFV